MSGTPLYFHANGFGLKPNHPLVFMHCFAWVLRRTYTNLRTHMFRGPSRKSG